MPAGHNQYSPMTGLPACAQVAAKIARSYGATSMPTAK
jgi:hypothetical protein